MNDEITLKQFKTAKDNLEKHLLLLIRDFEREYSSSVVDIKHDQIGSFSGFVGKPLMSTVSLYLTVDV